MYLFKTATKPYICAIIAVFFITPQIAFAKEYKTGTLVKTAGNPDIYYIASDKKRYLFPNESTYKSWYKNFSKVRTISGKEMEDIIIGDDNITIRPGTKLIRFDNSYKIYAVDIGATLRWITNEYAARRIFGMDWNAKIIDLPSEYLSSYVLGTELNAHSKFLSQKIKNWARSIDNELRDRDLIVRLTENTRDQNKQTPIPKLQALNENLYDNLSPKFNPDTKIYRLTALPYENKIRLLPIPENENATVLVNNAKLPKGGDITVSIGNKRRKIIKIKVLESGAGSSTYTIIITHKSLSTNAQLSDLKENLKWNGFDKKFHKYTTDYSIRVGFSQENIGLKAITEDPEASITIKGTPVNNNSWHTVKLSYGKNIIDIIVTAPSGYAKKYTVTVHRERWPNYDDTNLKELTANLYSSIRPAFNPNITVYYLRARRNEERVLITAKPKNNNAYVTINGETTQQKSIRLSPGRNEINITVELSDEFIKEYKIYTDRLYY